MESKQNYYGFIGVMAHTTSLNLDNAIKFCRFCLNIKYEYNYQDEQRDI